MSVEWHEVAREMRREGSKLIDIGNKFGVTVERVRQVCVGIDCPIEHRGAVFRDPEWRIAHGLGPTKRIEREEFIRAHYKSDMTAAQIALELGVTKNAIISSARDLGLCAPRERRNDSATVA